MFGHSLTPFRKRNKAIRGLLFAQSQLQDNEPENLFAIYETLVVLLQAYSTKELGYALPLIFKLEVKISA